MILGLILFFFLAWFIMGVFFFFAEKLKSAFQTVVIIWHRDKRGYTVQYDGVLHNHLDSW